MLKVPTGSGTQSYSVEYSICRCIAQWSPGVVNFLPIHLLLLLQNFRKAVFSSPFFSPLEAKHSKMFSLTATSRSLICFNVDFMLNAGRLLLRQRRLKGNRSCLIGRPRRRCINSSSLSLCSNFSTLLFFCRSLFTRSM